MRALSDCRLYGIVDLSYVEGSDAAGTVKQMLEGGVDLIQLRGKGKSLDELIGHARTLNELTSRSSTPLIVNDHAEIVGCVSVEGVHIGQDDDSIEVARRKAGRRILVGKSTHSLQQAIAAQQEGADYIGFGPIFATASKPGRLLPSPHGIGGLRRAVRRSRIPLVAIGGITIERAPEVAEAGARCVAAIAELCFAPDPELATREMAKAFAR